MHVKVRTAVVLWRSTMSRFRIGSMRSGLVAASALALAVRLPAQQPRPHEATPPGGISTEQMAKANNPLADMNALNFQNYYVPGFQGYAGYTANTLNLRGVVIAGRNVIRATLPVASIPTGAGQISGLGDFNVFDAIRLTPAGATMDLAVGPLLVVPTHTDPALGPETWQAGAAMVVMKSMSGGHLLGGLVTLQTDLGGSSGNQTLLLAAQPVLTLNMGGGYYFRSSGAMTFDLEGHNHVIPLGLGIGRVFRAGTTVVNSFVEPQFTVYSHGANPTPSLQLFMGLNLQRIKG